MTKVIFKFEKEKDLWGNWYEANLKSNWLTPRASIKLKEICEGKNLKNAKKNYPIIY